MGRLDVIEEKLDKVEKKIEFVLDHLETQRGLLEKQSEINLEALQNIRNRFKLLENSLHLQSPSPTSPHDTDYDENSPNIWNTYFFPPARN
jgi:hypothetical protein